MHAYFCMQIKGQCNELIHENILSMIYLICTRYLTYPDLTLYMYISPDISLQWLNPTQKEIRISYV